MKLFSLAGLSVALAVFTFSQWARYPLWTGASAAVVSILCVWFSFFFGVQFGKSVERNARYPYAQDSARANLRRSLIPRCQDCGCHDLDRAPSGADDCPCRCHVPGSDLHYERLSRLRARALHEENSP